MIRYYPTGRQKLSAAAAGEDPRPKKCTGSGNPAPPIDPGRIRGRRGRRTESGPWRSRTRYGRSLQKHRVRGLENRNARRPKSTELVRGTAATFTAPNRRILNGRQNALSCLAAIGPSQIHVGNGARCQGRRRPPNGAGRALRHRDLWYSTGGMHFRKICCVLWGESKPSRFRRELSFGRGDQTTRSRLRGCARSCGMRGLVTVSRLLCDLRGSHVAQDEYSARPHLRTSYLA